MKHRRPGFLVAASRRDAKRTCPSLFARCLLPMKVRASLPCPKDDFLLGAIVVFTDCRRWPPSLKERERLTFLLGWYSPSRSSSLSSSSLARFKHNSPLRSSAPPAKRHRGAQPKRVAGLAKEDCCFRYGESAGIDVIGGSRALLPISEVARFSAWVPANMVAKDGSGLVP